MRLIVVAVIRNQAGEILICRKPKNRGVFPGQWALPGGGIEEGETVEIALRREVMEEVGLEITDLRPLFFSEGAYPKKFPDGTRRSIYMVFLMFECLATSPAVQLNEEFEAHGWVNPGDLGKFDLNLETARTFTRMGLISRPEIPPA
jgi:nucleoside triphosphatase